MALLKPPKNNFQLKQKTDQHHQCQCALDRTESVARPILCVLLINFSKNLLHWCVQVYSGLQTRIGLINHIADGFSWMLLRCIPDDQKVHSAQRFALKGECNSRLALALKIMEECFLPIVDPRTGIDMIPHVLYNWR
ncbi:hypothetical protein CJ030_MR0G008678 [Morella rubra]|uniref:Uncharacterized protein n=1 Tax=Morella rubra TaxID=262757 RepID=A0A6A1UJL7_9ROSI|nr:hypothetical protein CJ030_MR0G008678 [Morella rubra]